ncbi:MAG: hypothetical protein PQJ46_16705 [Spirochaetales bacterium]|nr:hypothetical protein [Spirochaetales bacterium]
MMKRFISFLLFTAVILSYCSATSILNEIEDFSKLSPRPEGSKNEEATLALIAAKLDEAGVNYNIINFADAEGYYSFSSYIEADIAGNINDTIITVVPIYSNFAIASALDIIKEYIKTRPQLTLKFVFLGAETSQDNNLGTKNFLAHYYQQNNSCFIYLNFKNSPEAVRIIPGAEGIGTPFFLLESVKKALKTSKISFLYSNIESLLFRMSIAGKESMIKDYLEEGYPAIQLETLTSTENNSNNIISHDKLTLFYSSIISSFEDGIPSDWDNHYIFGMSEQYYIFCLLFCVTLIMFYPILRRRHFGWYMHTLKRNMWIPPILFFIIFIFLSISTLLINLIIIRMGFPSLWKYRPITFFCFKLSLSLLMYSIAFKIITKLPFSKKGSFYSISAIFFLTIELFIICWINLTFSFFALWPLVFIFFFTIFKKPVLKLILIIFAILPIVLSVIAIFRLPAVPAQKLLILSPLSGDMLIALSILPIILAIIRLDMMNPISNKFTHLLPLFFAVTSLSLFLIIIFDSPFDQENPQPVTITETSDLDSNEISMSKDSPASIDNKTIDSIFENNSKNKDSENFINADITAYSFLGRKNIKIKLSSNKQPESINLTLLSSDAITVFESNFPTGKSPDNNNLVIFTGKNPELPLYVTLTLNNDSAINLNIIATYPPENFNYAESDKYYSVKYIRKIKRTYNYAD